MVRKEIKGKLYEEEDHAWSKKELKYKSAKRERKTIGGLLLLVAESFVPENIRKQIKVFSKN
ncbi:MAG: hypothetical protein QM763_15800 [Agriterribacter sp.]